MPSIFTVVPQRFFLAVLLITHISICLLTMTKAMTMKEMLEGELKKVRAERQQQRQQPPQHLYGRERRDGEELLPCAPPNNLESLFRVANYKTDPQVLSIVHNPDNAMEGELCLDPSVPGGGPCPCAYSFTELHFPNGYYPPSLRKAQCLTQVCQNMTAYGCQVVSSHITVLQAAGCDEGLQSYKHVVLEVPTACACDVPHVRQTTTTSAPDSSSPWWVV